MKLIEVDKKLLVLQSKTRELHHMTALLRSIEKHEKENKLVPDPNYVDNIKRRIKSLELQFDELLK